MKIVVTGGAGFIGSHVAQACLAAGHEVLVVDDLSTGRREYVPEGARFYHLDIRDPALDDLLARERPEVVSHQAARASVRESMDRPLLYAEVNVLGSLHLLECCRRHGVRRVVYASTGGTVYGEPDCLPVTEDHPIRPRDPYGASKHFVEHYLELYRINYGLEYAALRYPNVFGPRQDPFGEAGVVAIFCRQMLEGSTPIVNGSGEQQRDYVYVSDVARANLLALASGANGVYNIGSGVGTSVNRLFELLADLTGYPHPPVYGPAKAGEVFCIYLEAGLAHEELGWAPEVPLDEGLARTVAHFQAALPQLSGATARLEQATI